MLNIQATQKTAVRAEFSERATCITCGKDDLKTLSSGTFEQGQVGDFLREDPWGVDPMPYLVDSTWDFVECRACKQRFHKNILTDDWINVFYSEWISSDAIELYYRRQGETRFQRDFKIGKHSIERALMLEHHTQDLRGYSPVRVLDFGCGEGRFLSTCSDLGFEGVGVEFSAAREKTKRVAFFNKLEQVEKEYGLGYFHVVTLFEVLEHLAAPLDILKALSNHIVPGGMLVLETPDCSGVTGIETRQEFELIHPLSHINAFTAESQARIAQEAGFRRITPTTVQLSTRMPQALKREARRILKPLLKRSTQQVFVKS